MKHIIIVLSLLFCLIILPKKSEAKYCVLHFTYTFSGYADYYDVNNFHTLSDIPWAGTFATMTFLGDDVCLFIYPYTDMTIVLGNNPEHFSFEVLPFYDPSIVLVDTDTLVEGKTYSKSLYATVPSQVIGYLPPDAITEVTCHLSMFVTFSIQYYDELKFESHLCEGNIIPVNNSLFTLTEKVNYENGEILRNPIFLISAVDDSDQWETITQSDLTFNGFQDFVSQHFPGKSVFDDRFKIKIKYLLFETEPVLLPQYYRNYPINEANPTIIDKNLQATLQANDNVAIESYFKQIQNGTFDSKNFDADGFLINSTGRVSLNGPYRLIFDRDGHYCTVTYHAFVPDVVYNTVNSSDKVFWYPTQTREAVTLAFKYPQGNDEQFNFVLTPNNSATHRWVDEDNGSIEVYSLFDDSKTDTLNCKSSSLIFNTNSTLSTIEASVTSNDPTKMFIPVTINLDELKSYPNISATVKIDQPLCDYSKAYLNVQDIRGGLKQSADGIFDASAYSYKINGEGDFLELDNDKIELPQSLEEFSIVFYDRDAEKDGRDERSETIKNLLVKRPQKLEINGYDARNLRCYNDESGSIEVTDVQPSYDINEYPLSYTWYTYPEGVKLSSTNSKIESLSCGSYQVVITNNSCTFTSNSIYIDEPPLLQFTQVSPIHAQCFNYSNGSIFSSVDGGTPFEDGGYRYAWNVGAITNNLLNIPAGNYHLTVTDAHDCDVSTEIEITQPDELINSLTPSYTICQGSELLIDDGKENMKDFDSYEWHLPNGTTKPGRSIVVTSDMPQGEYVLVSKKNVPDSKDKFCFTTDATTITFADNNLPIRFLVPTESFFDDTLVIAEDSEIDDDYTWHYAFNTEMFSDITDKVVNSNANLTFLHIDRSGNDTITMYADNGFCKASLSKEVTVSPHFREEDYDYTVDAAGIFSRLQIGPNPNNGEFTLFANLTEDSPLTISLYDVMRSRKIPIDFTKYKTPASHYQIPFQGLGLHSGAYTLLVSANGETKQIKFVVE